MHCTYEESWASLSQRTDIDLKGGMASTFFRNPNDEDDTFGLSRLTPQIYIHVLPPTPNPSTDGNHLRLYHTQM